MWRHPDMTAGELSEMLPGRSAKAVRRIRERYGRWRTEGVVPLCQRCGVHPVSVHDREAARLGLCAGCMQDEREWREEQAARNAALRQRRMRRRRRGA